MKHLHFSPPILVIILLFTSCNFNAKKAIWFGDSHAGRGTNFKPGYPTYMANLKDTHSDIKFALFAGDLTDSGFINTYIETDNQFGQEHPVIDGYGQWGKLCTYWVNRLIEKNIEVYLCSGNHDKYYNKDQHLTIVDLLKTHYNHLNHKSTATEIAYAFVIGNCHFICLGTYPDNEIRKWLKNYLISIGSQAPVFLFFHYPVIRSKFDYFRNPLYDLIEQYNIKAIITGHIYSFTAYWREKKIPLYGVGGNYFAVVDFNATTGDINLNKTVFHGKPNYTQDVWVTKEFYDPELYLGYIDTNNQIKSDDDDLEENIAEGN